MYGKNIFISPYKLAYLNIHTYVGTKLRLCLHLLIFGEWLLYENLEQAKRMYLRRAKKFNGKYLILYDIGNNARKLWLEISCY